MHRSFWEPISFFKVFRIEPPDHATIAVFQFIWRTSLLTSAIGFFSRTSMIVAAITTNYLYIFYYSHGFLHHQYQILTLISLIFMCSMAGSACSVDSTFSKSKPIAGFEFTWPLRLIWFVRAIMFFSAGLSKLRNSGLSWVLGDSMNDIVKHNLIYFGQGLGGSQLNLSLSNYFIARPVLCQFAAALTIVIEVGAPLILLHKKIRSIGVLSLMALQVAIWLILRVDFSPQALCYIFFVPWQRLLPHRALPSAHTIRSR